MHTIGEIGGWKAGLGKIGIGGAAGLERPDLEKGRVPNRGRAVGIGLAAMAGFMAPAAAFAQDAVPTMDKGDTVWMMVATALVLFMLMPGLALFYGGLVRKNNVLTIVMQSVACACVPAFFAVLLSLSLSHTSCACQL